MHRFGLCHSQPAGARAVRKLAQGSQFDSGVMSGAWLNRSGLCREGGRALSRAIYPTNLSTRGAAPASLAACLATGLCVQRRRGRGVGGGLLFMLLAPLGEGDERGWRRGLHGIYLPGVTALEGVVSPVRHLPCWGPPPPAQKATPHVTSRGSQTLMFSTIRTCLRARACTSRALL